MMWHSAARRGSCPPLVSRICAQPGAADDEASLLAVRVIEQLSLALNFAISLSLANLRHFPGERIAERWILHRNRRVSCMIVMRNTHFANYGCVPKIRVARRSDPRRKPTATLSSLQSGGSGIGRAFAEAFHKTRKSGNRSWTPQGGPRQGRHGQSWP